MAEDKVTTIFYSSKLKYLTQPGGKMTKNPIIWHPEKIRSRASPVSGEHTAT